MRVEEHHPAVDGSVVVALVVSSWGHHLTRSDDQEVAGAHPTDPRADRQLASAEGDQRQGDEVVRVRSDRRRGPQPRQIREADSTDRWNPGLPGEPVYRHTVHALSLIHI